MIVGRFEDSSRLNNGITGMSLIQGWKVSVIRKFGGKNFCSGRSGR